MDGLGDLALRSCLGMVGAVVAAVVVVVWREWSRARRARAIEAADRALDAQQGCAACGNPDVAEVGDQVYVCPACGYEGGEGYAAFETARRREQLLARPEGERARLAVDRREEAARLLTTALGDFERLRPELVGDVRGRDPRVAHAWESELLQAFQWTREGLVAWDEARLLEDGTDPETARALDAIEPRMWYSGELGAEVDLEMVRLDVQTAATAAQRALDQQEAS